MIPKVSIKKSINAVINTNDNRQKLKLLIIQNHSLCCAVKLNNICRIARSLIYLFL